MPCQSTEGNNLNTHLRYKTLCLSAFRTSPTLHILEEHRKRIMLTYIVFIRVTLKYAAEHFNFVTNVESRFICMYAHVCMYVCIV